MDYKAYFREFESTNDISVEVQATDNKIDNPMEVLKGLLPEYTFRGYIIDYNDSEIYEGDGAYQTLPGDFDSVCEELVEELETNYQLP